MSIFLISIIDMFNLLHLQIRVARCPRVTSRGIEHLLHLLPHLEVLDVCHTSVGPWLGHNQESWVKVDAYSKSLFSACPAITGFHGELVLYSYSTEKKKPFLCRTKLCK